MISFTMRRALREKVGTGFSQEQCSMLLKASTFFAFGRSRPKATWSLSSAIFTLLRVDAAATALLWCIS
jgi:hypothetical protein